MLKDSSDYQSWFEHVQYLAKGYNVWEYVDPDGDTAEPKPPTFDSIREQKMKDFDGFDLTGKEKFVIIESALQGQQTRFEKLREHLTKIRSYIRESIDSSLIADIEGLATPQEMLKALRSHLVQTNEVRNRGIKKRLAELCAQLSSSSDITKWLTEFNNLATKAERYKLTAWSGREGALSLIEALEAVDTTFATMWAARMRQDTKKDTYCTEIIQDFRDHRSMLQKGVANQSRTPSFGAFGAKAAKYSTNSTPQTCEICQGNHRYERCWYIFPNIPKRLRVKQEIVDKLNSRKASDAEFAKKVAAATKKLADGFAKKNNEQKDAAKPAESGGSNQEAHLDLNGVFTVAASTVPTDADFLLRYSFIIDSGATIHICNQRDRFTAIKPATDPMFANRATDVFAGGHKLAVLGWGIIAIRATVNDGTTLNLTIGKVAYVPDMFTSMISEDNLEELGVDVVKCGLQKRELTRNGKHLCQLRRMEGLHVIEFNDPTKFAATSMRTIPTSISAYGAAGKSKIRAESYECWHNRMGHIGAPALTHLTSFTQDVSIIKSDTIFATTSCESCQISNVRQQISRVPQGRSQTPFEKLHFDLIQLAPNQQEERYVIHFVDDYSSFHWAFPAAQKTLLRHILTRLIPWVRTQLNVNIKTLRADNETTVNTEIRDWLALQGINLETSAPYTPAQNGIAERAGGVLIAKARAMRQQANLPHTLWREIIGAAAYLTNRTPTERIQWRTPTELLYKFRPKLAHLRVYGCKAYVRIPNIPRTMKLAARGVVGYLVGYEASTIYRIWIPSANKVVRTRDVTFNEDLFFEPQQQLQEVTEEVIQLIHIEEEEELTPAVTPSLINPSNPPNLLLESTPNPQVTEPNLPLQQPLRKVVNTVEAIEKPPNPPGIQYLPSPAPTPNVTPEPALIGGFPEEQPVIGGFPQEEPSPAPEEADTDQSSESEPEDIPHEPVQIPAQQHIHTPSSHLSADLNVANIIDGKRTRKASKRAQGYAVTLANASNSLSSMYMAFNVAAATKQPHQSSLPPEPKHWNQMKKHPHAEGFKAAAWTEWENLWNIGTFSRIKRSQVPPFTPIIPLTWAYLYKLDDAGFLKSYKSRLCVRGDLQAVNREDTYSSTLAFRHFRALAALKARFGLRAEQLDAIAAFLNAQLDEDKPVYVAFPQGFRDDEVVDGIRYVLRLNRALYGMRSSPLLWLREITQTLIQLGFKPLQDYPCIFRGTNVILFFYVDDIIIMAKDQEPINSAKRQLMNRYKLHELGPLRWFLGVKITTLPNGDVLLNQQSYCEKLMTTFNLEARRQFETPLPTDLSNLTPNLGTADAQARHLFQQKVGSLIYAAVTTRPDVIYAATRLAGFMTNPSTIHAAYADRVIQYLYATRNMSIRYQRQPATTYEAVSDASYADRDHRRSTEAFVMKLFGGPIDWRSNRQPTVTLSSTEAELYAITHAAKDIIQWERFFTQIGLDLGTETLVLGCDNQQTIRLLTSAVPLLTTRLKHVDVHQNWLRQQIQCGQFAIEWVPTKSISADGLTKSLSGATHQTFCQLLGLFTPSTN